jgi:mannosyltransferase
VSSLPPAGPHRAGLRSLALLLIVVLAAVARFHGLSSQLWVDEIDALRNSIRRPPLSIVMDWPASTPHVLADLAAHASVAVFGERPWSVRLPAALFGTGSVALLYLLARRALGGTAATLAAVLMAVWAPHVFQSQNARGYTALLFFSLLAAGLFLRSCDGPEPRLAGPAYVVAAALAAYALFFGAVVPPAHVLAAAVLGAGAGRCRLPWSTLLVRAAASLGLAAVLYAPILSSLVTFLSLQPWKPADCDAQSGWLSPMGMIREAIFGLAEGFGGLTGLGLALAAAAVGVVTWARRHPLSLAVLAMPVVLQAALSSVANMPLNPRYFVLALPVLLVAIGKGLAVLIEAAGARSPRARIPAVLAAGGALLLWASPLRHYYATPKQDFAGALRQVDEGAAPGDLRVAVHLAGRVYREHYGAPLRYVDTLPELAAAEAEGKRIWLVTTLERHLDVVRPDLYRHVRGEYREWAVLPATVRDAEMRVYVREPGPR